MFGRRSDREAAPKPLRTQLIDELHDARTEHLLDEAKERRARLAREAAEGKLWLRPGESHAIDEDVRVITGPVPVIDAVALTETDEAHSQAS